MPADNLSADNGSIEDINAMLADVETDILLRIKSGMAGAGESGQPHEVASGEFAPADDIE